MAVMAGMALAGIGINLLGKVAEAQQAKEQAIFHRQELAQKSRISKSLFDLNFPNFQKQQRANRGKMATDAARGNVAVESVSVVALLSEQARIDSINQSLAQFQQTLDQQSFKFAKSQSKRDTKAINQNLTMDAISSGVQAGSALHTAGILG